MFVVYQLGTDLRDFKKYQSIAEVVSYVATVFSIILATRNFLHWLQRFHRNLVSVVMISSAIKAGFHHLP